MNLLDLFTQAELGERVGKELQKALTFLFIRLTARHKRFTIVLWSNRLLIEPLHIWRSAAGALKEDNSELARCIREEQARD